MKKYNFILSAGLVLIMMGSVGTVSFAQERVENTTNAEVSSDSVEAANYNNTRSNRSSVAAPDTNVCDGVTCSDGSCAATVDECTAIDTAVDSVCNGFVCNDGQCVTSEAMCGITDVVKEVCDTRDEDCDDDGLSDGTDEAAVAPVQDYNATRSNKPSSMNVGGGDCDDTDERCAPGAARPVDAVCDTLDDDCDGEIPDEDLRAQDYNSSRSNKAPTAANPVDHLDDDDDGDSLPTEVGARASAQGQLFGTYLNAEGSAGTEALKKGDRLSTSADESDSDRQPEFARFSDIQGEVRVDQETGARELASVAVAAQDLRDWNNDDRAAFNRLQTTVASNTPEQASLRIAQQVLNNEKIERLEVTQTEARINYRAEMRLFGLIPVEREVEARAQADGTVEIDYPWYHFVSTTPDRAEIETQLQTSIEIMMTLTADPI